MGCTVRIMDGGAATVERGRVDTEFVDRFLAARVTEAESAAFIRQPSEVVIFTLLAIQARLGDAKPAAGPNTPSGAVPPY
ncbi:MAG: hypothetical protein ACK5Q5_06580, partial [Planctomycetaceae bacterium]